MKKKKFYPIMTAALVAVTGLSVAYAADISDFVKSLFNKNEVYSTITEGETYYLETPTKLNEGITLNSVIFTADTCMLNLEMESQNDEFPEIKLHTESGEVYEPGGYMKTDKGVDLLFMNMEEKNYKFRPGADIKLNISGKSYDVKLQKATSVTDGGVIVEAEPTELEWADMGFKKSENGVQILTSFSDNELKLRSIGKPVEGVVKGSFENMDDGSSLGSVTSTSPEAIFGYDADGNAYEYTTDKNATGIPIVMFESEAPQDREIELKIPAVVVGYDKSFGSFDVKLPDVGVKNEIAQEIDLSVQKMVFDSIERTSETTAELVFTLNTGEKEEASIRDAGILSSVKKGEYVIDGGTMIVTLEFKNTTEEIHFSLDWPSFTINGNWVLKIPPR